MFENKKNLFKFILVIAIALTAYYFGRISNHPTAFLSQQAYYFDSKTFFDNKKIIPSNENWEQVYIAGTLTGDGVGYKDNTTAITCYKDRMECLVNSIQGISETSCQLGRLDLPQIFPVTNWDDYVITATTGNLFDKFSCVRTTINIDRKSETAEWVQEPINQSELSCKDFHDNKIYKWTIEDPTWMKDFKSNLKK